MAILNFAMPEGLSPDDVCSREIHVAYDGYNSAIVSNDALDPLTLAKAAVFFARANVPLGSIFVRFADGREAEVDYSSRPESLLEEAKIPETAGHGKGWQVINIPLPEKLEIDNSPRLHYRHYGLSMFNPQDPDAVTVEQGDSGAREELELALAGLAFKEHNPGRQVKVNCRGRCALVEVNDTLDSLLKKEDLPDPPRTIHPCKPEEWAEHGDRFTQTIRKVYDSMKDNLCFKDVRRVKSMLEKAKEMGRDASVIDPSRKAADIEAEIKLFETDLLELSKKYTGRSEDFVHNQHQHAMYTKKVFHPSTGRAIPQRRAPAAHSVEKEAPMTPEELHRDMLGAVRDCTVNASIRLQRAGYDRLMHYIANGPTDLELGSYDGIIPRFEQFKIGYHPEEANIINKTRGDGEIEAEISELERDIATIQKTYPGHSANYAAGEMKVMTRG